MAQCNPTVECGPDRKLKIKPLPKEKAKDKTTQTMMQLEQQGFKILDIMYDSMTKHNFDSISDAVDRVSDAVDRDLDKVDTNNIKLTYDNDSDTNTGSTKYKQNTKGAHIS